MAVRFGPLAGCTRPPESAFLTDMNKTTLLIVRYGIGGAMVVAGIVLLITNSGGFGVDGFALGAGGGLSVILINLLYRFGVSGDRERDEEQEARAFMERYGRWPDEVPSDQRPRVRSGDARPTASAATRPRLGSATKR